MLAPSKALCQQRVKEWKETFGSLGFSVLELTGDINTSEALNIIQDASIIVTTPEKWDSMTRSWRNNLFLFGMVDLLLIDEIHHIGEDRGATLEMIVVRMRFVRQNYIKHMREHNNKVMENMRIVALSATLPNAEDIGVWLGCKPQTMHLFDESFRPVPLTTHVIAYGSSKNAFLFDRGLDDKVSEVIRRYSHSKQTIVFCFSKNTSESLAQKLANQLRFNVINISSHYNTVNQITDTKLRNLIATSAIAYHHSGLPPSDRNAVEVLYLANQIQVLCSTTTLAHGLNLPAHLVIIKGTNSWKGSQEGYASIKNTDIIQMIGRAGRPGLDDHGVAVIMTSNEQKLHYEAAITNPETVESSLLSNLTEAICAEITQQIITCLNDAIQWAKTTFFYVR